jgi:hypothetical protein
MITRCALDQAECIENTLALPHQISTLILRRLMGEKNRLKAERAWFLTEEVRRAEPETEPLLIDLWSAHWTQISGGSKGVFPLGRRAGVRILPEKGRQGAVSIARRTSEGGKRSCAPSEGS